MNIETNIPLLEEVLSEFKDIIAEDYIGYKNHVYRILHCCYALHDCNDEERQKLFDIPESARAQMLEMISDSWEATR